MNLLSSYRELFNKDNNNRYWIVTGSRGSAKSFHIATYALNLTYEPNEKILYTRWTLTSAHISVIPEFIEKIELLNKQDDFEVTKTEIVNKKTGSMILFRGIKTSQGTATANLKSIQGVTNWIVEEAEELTDEDVFDKVNLSIRAKHTQNRIILVMNPAHKGHFIYKRFIQNKQPNTSYIHTTYLNNAKNLSNSFLEQANRMKEQNLIRYRHLFLGEWLDDAEGLLWNRQMIERLRITEAPNINRIVVAIDPAVTANEKSDETGIVVVGKDQAGNCYVLEDLSGKYTPAQWGTVASQAFKAHGADCYVAEKNQGGLLVENLIRQYDKTNRVKLVTATKGKTLRAEPVYSLYEQGKVYHVGEHPILENQMITFNPEQSKISPDRVDALVYGVLELTTKAQINWTFS